MVDVSSDLNDPGRRRDPAAEHPDRILDAAATLQERVQILANAIVGGSGIERAEARDRYEVALTEFSALIDDTAE